MPWIWIKFQSEPDTTPQADTTTSPFFALWIQSFRPQTFIQSNSHHKTSRIWFFHSKTKRVKLLASVSRPSGARDQTTSCIVATSERPQLRDASHSISGATILDFVLKTTLKDQTDAKVTLAIPSSSATGDKTCLLEFCQFIRRAATERQLPTPESLTSELGSRLNSPLKRSAWFVS